MGMVVNCAAYEDGRRVADIDIDKLDDWPAKDGRVIWIGLHEPTAELLTKLQRHFGLHTGEEGISSYSSLVAADDPLRQLADLLVEHP